MHNDDSATDAERTGLAASGTSGSAEATDPAVALAKYPIDPSTRVDLERRFTYHRPKDDQPQRYERLRAQALDLAKEIVMLTPKCREQSLALTKLEEACFFANAAIARGE